MLSVCRMKKGFRSWRMTMRGMGVVLAFSWGVVHSPWAHESGHGPAISGKGKSGGALAEVVLAQDAEKGTQAPIAAIAEWRRTGSQIAFEVWDPAQKVQQLFPKGSEFKLIALGGSLSSPSVSQSTLSQASSRVSLQPKPGVLDQADRVELILTLPGQGKAVFLAPLRVSSP